jgi:putative transposase
MKKKHLGGVYNLNYHLVWTPKYRKSVLVGLIGQDAKDIISSKAVEIGVCLESIEVMPDHVHVFVSAPPKLSPHQIVKKFKGASSNILRKKYPQLLRLPALWSSSYYCGSVGHVSESVVKHYIESQKGV